MTKQQCRACGKWFEDSELDAHLSEHMNEPEREEDVEEEVEQLPLESPLPQDAELDRKRGLSYSTKYSPEETLSKAETYLRASGYDVRVQGSILQALSEGQGREYTWSLFLFVVVVGSFVVQLVLSQIPLVGLVSLLLYLYWWFGNRGQNRIVLTVKPGQFAIRHDGSTAFRNARQLSNMLQG